MFLDLTREVEYNAAYHQQDERNIDN